MGLDARKLDCCMQATKAQKSDQRFIVRFLDHEDRFSRGGAKLTDLFMPYDRFNSSRVYIK